MNTIQITVNGEPLRLPPASTLADCITEGGPATQPVGTAVNGQFVSREQRTTYALQNGDAVFTFAPITGG